jgi:hypothetical protein
VTGQAGDWNIGLVNIFQEAQFDNNNFSAMRVSRNVGRQSSAGMIATLGNATAAGSNALYGLDTRLATSTLGGDKNLAFTAYGMRSVTGFPDIEVPGMTRRAGNAFGADLNYPNDLFFGRAGFLQSTMTLPPAWALFRGGGSGNTIFRQAPVHGPAAWALCR